MSVHIPVLLQEVTDGLDLHDGDVVLDCTLGAGGYSDSFCKEVSDLTLIGIDQDPSAVRRAQEVLTECGATKHFVESNFRNLDAVLKDLGITEVNAIAFDLGFSSDQLENSGRGFSFKNEEPLLMTLKEEVAKDDITAEQIVNDWSEESIANVLIGYGEEKYAARIASAIVEARKEERIETTDDLVTVIDGAVPERYKRGRIHFATRTFQALRIAANDELEALKEGLDKAVQALAEGGRLAVVSFHSLEDRIVKRFYKEKEAEGVVSIVTKKPITPTEKEIEENPRSRSAKLRICTKH